MITEEDISMEYGPIDDHNEKDQRRLALLNDPNYGIILCFLERFRLVLDLPVYSLQRLEDHLVQYQERIPSRLIDFHFILLKRLSLAKNTQREKFDSIITKFAFRFDLNDGDHLTTAGYLQSEINIKIRILKNLLESQFDLNQTFKNTLIEKSAREIKSTPLGRDRFGVSYWLFMDTDCFVRLFREDVDLDRTWSNVAKNRDELEKFIKLLITDTLVRKKFSDWTIDYEPFSSLTPSMEFEECYLPTAVDVKEEEPIEEDEKSDELTKKKRGRPKGSVKSVNNQIISMEVEIKEEEEEEEFDSASTDDEKPVEPMKKRRGRPKGSVKSVNSQKIPMEMIEEESDPESTDDEKPIEPMKKRRGRPKGSVKSVNNEKIPIEIKEEDEEEFDPASTDDEKPIEPMKKKRGRPKGSIASIKKEIKQEEDEIEPASNNEDEKLFEPLKKKRGRPKGSIKLLPKGTNQLDIKIKEEKQEIESTLNHNETSDISIKKQRGRPKSLTKQVSVEFQPTSIGDKKSELPKYASKSLTKEIKPNNLEIKEEVVTPARKGRKRKIIMEENTITEEEYDKQNEESSIDNTNASIRRSSRPRKAISTIEPTFIDASKTISQIPTTKKKRPTNGKSKNSNDFSTANNKSGRSRRRRKTTSRRNINDDFCLSSSSADEHVDYLSDDEYDSDDYLPNLSQTEHDDNFFALDEDNNTPGEELRTAKTAQASTIITTCSVCSKSDRPEVLLLCDDCDDAYHLECLRPILLSVPDGDWFCPLCEHKKLSNHLIEKLKELLINFNLVETKRLEYERKKSLQRKIKRKEYTSDESSTASESEHENLEDTLNGEESMLSISQTNENSNISSSYYDDPNKNISQRGRRRRTRFDMNKMLNDDNESDDNSDTDHDDEYIENPSQIANFDLQLPKKMTRLLNHRYRPLVRNDQRFKPKPIAPRVCHTSSDLNDKHGSTMIYFNGDGNTHQIKSVITNSNQTIKIVRRWNDVQRRNKLRTNNMKLLNETTSDCADENSVFCPDETSPPRSNDSYSNNNEIKDEDSTIIRSKITLAQPTNLLPMYKSSTKNIVKKNEVTFDRLTRDIQYAVSEAHTLSAIPKAIDQQHIKRIQKTNFSPYLTKVTLRPLPVILPKPAGIGYKIFKSKDPPTSTDLSNIILTPSSSSSLLDANDEQSTSTMNT